MSIAKPQTTSLIDTLNQGFSAINRRIWVIVIPVLLNAYIWYGSQVSFQPLINSLVSLMEQRASTLDANATSEQYAVWREIGLYNLLPRLDALKLVPHLSPYVVNSAGSGGLPLPAEVLAPLDPGRAVVEVNNVALAIGLYFGFNLLAIPLGAVFFTMLAGAVNWQQPQPSRFIVRLGRALAAFLGYAALLLAAALVIGLPVAIVGSLLALVSPALGALIALLVLTASFWLGIYLGFTPEAIVINGLDPLQAIRASFTLVRRNFWNTLFLLIISVVISIGMGALWYVLVATNIGLVVAILGSAYIGSGLIATRMIFFRERIGKSDIRVTANG